MAPTKSKGLSNVEIEMHIIPTMVRWPSPEQRPERSWNALREAGELLRGLIKNVDAQAVQAESDPDLSGAGIARRRMELGKNALAELESWSPLISAEKLVADNVKLLEDKMVDLPGRPQTAVDALLAQEVRQHIKGMKRPIDYVMGALADPHVVGAVLNAPAFLSGLTPTEHNFVREKARRALHPEQVALQEQLTKTLNELRGGVESAKRLLRERCQVPAPGLTLPNQIQETEPAI